MNRHARKQMERLGRDLASLIGKVVSAEFPDMPREHAPTLRRVMIERVTLPDEVYFSPSGERMENHMYPRLDGC